MADTLLQDLVLTVMSADANKGGRGSAGLGLSQSDLFNVYICLTRFFIFQNHSEFMKFMNH